MQYNNVKWVPVKGYEGRYSISDAGEVRADKSLIVKKQHIDKDGYLKVQLWDGIKYRHHRTHRLVLTSFNVQPEDQTVNHINEKKTDNRLINLEWKSFRDNKLMASHKGGSSKLTEAQVIAIRLSSLPINKICIQYGVNEPCIRKIKQRKTWKHI